jgi:hypothetical protein
MAERQTVEQAFKNSVALFSTGVKFRVIKATLNIVNGTTATGDIIRIAKGLALANRILGIFVPKTGDAIAGLTDIDFGFYKSNVGAVIDKDILVDGLDPHLGQAVGELIGANAYKSIGEHLVKNNDQEYAGGVDLAVTLNATPSASGTVPLWIFIAG